MYRFLQKYKILLLIIILATAFSPLLAFAQINYTPLEPLPGITSNGGTVSGLGTYLPAMFTLAIEIAAALAVIMITIGGIEYIGSESISSKGDGIKKIQNALVGLLLAIGAWVILSTINPNLVSFNLSITSFTPPPPPTGGGGGGTPGAGACTPNPSPYPSPNSPYYSTYPCGSSWPSDSNERSSLSNIGVQFNHSNCALVGDLNCTSVFQISANAISGLQWLVTHCTGGCSVMITGGTEFWVHTSHGPGTGMIDLHYGQGTTPLDRFIMSGTHTGTTNSCFSGMNSWTLNGIVYALEARPGYTTHWHVCYH